MKCEERCSYGEKDHRDREGYCHQHSQAHTEDQGVTVAVRVQKFRFNTSWKNKHTQTHTHTHARTHTQTHTDAPTIILHVSTLDSLAFTRHLHDQEQGYISQDDDWS